MDDKTLNLWRQIDGLCRRGRKLTPRGAADPAPPANIPRAPSPADQ